MGGSFRADMSLRMVSFDRLGEPDRDGLVAPSVERNRTNANRSRLESVQLEE